MRNDEKTRTMNDDVTQTLDDDVTQTLDDDVTQAFDDDATQSMDNHMRALTEIVNGDIINGYTVGVKISEKGGEAVIRLAEKGGKTYIVKVFNSGHSTDKDAENILVSLGSPYVMPILDRGEYKGIHYEILPFYRNGTFGDMLGKDVSLDWLMTFIRDVNEGLRAIHEKGVFHNDIKPSNVFISDDRKSAVIGDFGISRFGAERTHVTNFGNMTIYYAAPEAAEISNAQTDYFSFGMSIASIAFGKKLLEGFSEQQARIEIISGRISLPAEIPEDVRDLITMLTKHNPQDRITYDGVSKWLSNPKCFVGCRDQKEQTDNGLVINRCVFGRKGAKKDYHDTYSLAAAINDNQDIALEQQIVIFEVILNAIKTAPQQDSELYARLLKYHETYKNDFLFCLFLMLHALNPHLPIKFAGKELRNFKDYINMLQEDYGTNIDEHFAREEFLTVVLENSNIAEGASELISSVIKAYKAPIDIFDMLLNLFGNSERFYYDNVVYDSFGEFLNQKAFSKKGLPNAMKWEKMRNEFLSAYLDKLGVNKDSIENILNENDQVTEYFMLGKVLSGYIPLRLCGVQVRNFYEFVELIAQMKEAGKNAELDIINGFLNKDGHLKIIRFEKKPIEKSLVEIIGNAKNKISYIYYFCYPNARFLGCATVNDLVVLLGTISSGEIEKKSNDILSSEDYRIWMEKQGVRI